MTMATAAVAKRPFAEIPPAELDLIDVPGAVDCKVGETDVTARKRQFSTGSLGWFSSGEEMVHGVLCRVQVQVTISGSKPKLK